MTVKRCDIILPTCDQPKFLKDCVDSLISTTHYPYRLIVIDNGSSAESEGYLKAVRDSGRLDIVIIKPSENLGWIRAINKGLESSTDSEYVCFQNDDTVFTEGWLEELVGILEKDPGIGIANPEWEKPDNISAKDFAPGLKKHSGKTVDMDWCRGHCFFLKREVADKIGGFDTVYLPVYYDDRDYSLKAIAAGYRCVKAKGAYVEHVRNVTIKQKMREDKISSLMERNGRIFYKRWGYPQRLVLALGGLSGAGDFLRKICADQNKVIILSRLGSEVPYEHTNIKAIRLNPAAYIAASVAYILSNRSAKQQKKTDFIITDDKALNFFLKALKPFIPAAVIYNKDAAKLFAEALEAIKIEKESGRKGITL